MPRFNRLNNRNYARNNQNVHVAELIDNNDECEIKDAAIESISETSINSVVEVESLDSKQEKSIVMDGYDDKKGKEEYLSTAETTVESFEEVESNSWPDGNNEDWMRHEELDIQKSVKEVTSTPFLDIRDAMESHYHIEADYPVNYTNKIGDKHSMIYKPIINKSTCGCLNPRTEEITYVKPYDQSSIRPMSRVTNPIINHCRVRILHAAVGYEPIFVVIGNRRTAEGLGFGKISSYSRIMDGFGTVMVYSQSAKETPLLTTVLPFVAGTKLTLAIINSVRGLQVLPIQDTSCGMKSRDKASFRVANLTMDDGPFDICLSDGTLIFSDVNVKEVTTLKQALVGDYDFFVTATPVSIENNFYGSDVQNMQYTPSTEGGINEFNFYQRLVPDTMYTACIIGGYHSPSSLQVLVIEN